MGHNTNFANVEGLIEPYEKLRFNNAFIFGKVMEDVGRCTKMLQILTGNEINNVEELCVEKAVRATDDSKGVRYDVYIDDGQCIYDTEMENAKELASALPLRSRFYQGVIDLKDLEKGDEYTELKESYVIFICTFDPFGLGDACYVFSNLSNDNRHFELQDRRKIIFFNTKGTMEMVTDDARKFLQYIETGEVQDEFTEQLEEAVEFARHNRKWRSEYMMNSVHMMDAKRLGKIEGRAEGRLETLRSLVMDGDISLEKAADKANMSVEEFCKRVGIELSDF